MNEKYKKIINLDIIHINNTINKQNFINGYRLYNNYIFPDLINNNLININNSFYNKNTFLDNNNTIPEKIIPFDFYIKNSINNNISLNSLNLLNDINYKNEKKDNFGNNYSFKLNDNKKISKSDKKQKKLLKVKRNTIIYSSIYLIKFLK